MAYFTIKRISELARGKVLSPERYDPRRESLATLNGDLNSVPLRRIAECARAIVGPKSNEITDAIILDTSDAREGLVIGTKMPVSRDRIGSAKKLVREGDVIISRLRPYLRQVGYIDSRVPHWHPGVSLVCSTEFFVLRSIDGRSISFLIPLLLSGPVQAILSAAQEGGHHPRFNESTLIDLRVPKALLEQRERISTDIEFAACLYRDSESKMLAGIQTAEVGFLALKDSEQTPDASRSSLGAP
jgi:hypothetical protein